MHRGLPMVVVFRLDSAVRLSAHKHKVKVGTTANLQLFVELDALVCRQECAPTHCSPSRLMRYFLMVLFCPLTQV